MSCCEGSWTENHTFMLHYDDELLNENKLKSLTSLLPPREKKKSLALPIQEEVNWVQVI